MERESIFETAHEIGEHLVRISGKPLEQEAMELMMLATLNRAFRSRAIRPTSVPRYASDGKRFVLVVVRRSPGASSRNCTIREIKLSSSPIKNTSSHWPTRIVSP